MKRGGDTPIQETLWKYALGPTFILAGKLADVGDNQKNAQVYGPQENVVRIYTAEGVAQSTDSLSETFKSRIAAAILNTWGIQVNSVVWTLEPVAYGETLPNWDKYESVT